MQKAWLCQMCCFQVLGKAELDMEVEVPVDRWNNIVKEIFLQDELEHSTYSIHSKINHSIKCCNHFEPEFQRYLVGLYLGNGSKVHTSVVEMM